MESDDQQQWASWPKSSLVNYSNIRHSPCSAVSYLSSSSTNALTSSAHPENLVLNIEMARSAWSGTNRIQPPRGLSPCSVQYPAPNARYARDPTPAVSTLPPDPYSVIQGQFYNAIWRHAGELEPKDPTTGRSVLHVLLEECTDGNQGHISKCRLCNRIFSRADRAITHLRHKHLDHRPFWCGGACRVQGCQQRFHSPENLTPHVKPKMRSCPHCPHKCLRQNLKRHIEKNHLEQLGT